MRNNKNISLHQHLFSWKDFILFEILVTVVLFLGYGYVVYHDLKYIYIDIGADTYCSYWPIFLSYQNMLQEFEGFWSFQHGLGGTILGNTIDPFILIFSLFPKEKSAEALLLIAVMKHYTISGLSYLYFKKLGFSKHAVCFGALSYTFSGYVVSWGQHYNFCTAFIYLTLCLLAFEYWLHGGNWCYFTLSVAVLAFSSVYFTYMIMLFLAIYVVFRFFALCDFQLKSFVKYMLSLLAYVLLGFALGAVTLLPSIVALTQSARVTGSQGLQLQFGTPLYYLCALLRYFSDSILGVNEYYGSLGYFSGQHILNFYEMPFFYVGTLFVILLPLLFTKETGGILTKIVFIAGVLSVLLIGISGPIFNGFSTITMRWTMVLVPVQCTAICKAIDILLNNPVKYRRHCFVSAIICAVFLSIVYLMRNSIFNSALVGSQTAKIYMLVPLGVVALYALLFTVASNRKMNARQLMLALLFILVADLGRNAFMSASFQRSLMSDPASMYFDGTENAIEWINQNDQGFYRVEKTYRQIDLSDSLAQGYNGEKQYTSVATDDANSFKQIYNLRYPNSNYLYGFDDKQVLRNLSASKYCLSKTPIDRHGYNLVNKVNGIYIYENENSAPLAYLQNKVYDATSLPNDTMQERMNILFEGFLSDEESILSNYDVATQPELPYEVCDDYQKILNDEGYYTGITFDDPSSQTLVIRLKFEKGSIASGVGIQKSISITGQNVEPFNQDTYFINDSKADEYPIQEIELSTLGVEKIDWSTYAPNFPCSIEIMRKDDAAVDAYYENLKSNGMRIETFNSSHIKGHISATQAGMLVTSIPYNDGWSVFVDGEQVEIHKVNIMYLGVEIKEGNHVIEFTYLPTGMEIGAYISLISAIVLVAATWLEQRRKVKPVIE